jgi:hypothetical protein
MLGFDWVGREAMLDGREGDHPHRLTRLELLSAPAGVWISIKDDEILWFDDFPAHAVKPCSISSNGWVKERHIFRGSGNCPGRHLDAKRRVVEWKTAF